MAPSRFLRSSTAGLMGCDSACFAVVLVLFLSSAFNSQTCLVLEISHFRLTVSCGCVQAFWSSFMQDVDALARVHPYVVPPSARQGGEWVLCGLLGALPRRLFCQYAHGATVCACFQRCGNYYKMVLLLVHNASAGSVLGFCCVNPDGGDYGQVGPPAPDANACF